MITAGIDCGAKNTKTIIFKDGIRDGQIKKVENKVLLCLALTVWQIVRKLMIEVRNLSLARIFSEFS